MGLRQIKSALTSSFKLRIKRLPDWWQVGVKTPVFKYSSFSSSLKQKLYIPLVVKVRNDFVVVDEKSLLIMHWRNQEVILRRICGETVLLLKTQIMKIKY